MTTDKELLEFIDGNLSVEEADKIRNVIDHDDSVRNRYEILSSLDTMLSEQPQSSPSAAFAMNVMSNLNKRLAVDYSTFWKKNLAITISIVIIGFVAAIVLLSSTSLAELFPTLQAQEITISERTILLDPGKINFFNQDLFIKGMIYLNAFLAIFLIEKAVFRPLFKHRKQSYSL